MIARRMSADGIAHQVDGLEELLRALLDLMELPAQLWKCKPSPTAEDLSRGHLPDRPSGVKGRRLGLIAADCG